MELDCELELDAGLIHEMPWEAALEGRSRQAGIPIPDLAGRAPILSILYRSTWHLIDLGNTPITGLAY